jgi:hypothetical protein
MRTRKLHRRDRYVLLIATTVFAVSIAQLISVLW